MLSIKRRIISKLWLLLSSVLVVLNADVVAGPPLFSVFGNRKELSLSYSTFDGSDHRHESEKSLAFSANFAKNLVSMIGKPDDGRYPWKWNIVTTVFWIGEEAAKSNPVANTQSAWDLRWGRHYGGYDNPTDRANFIPARFIPRQNPFYVALPYNDVKRNHTKAEAAKLIPWFKNSFVRDGESVCKDRWLAIRHGNRICYAQWEDVGPFRVDRWQYVFGNERPFPNRNHNAGLDVSPAVRDYLGMSGMDVCDWKFVDLQDVPNGPWALYGNNNTVARSRRHGTTVIAKE
jgi:hypothetical protein